ncbi:DUF4277 domain-containing protein [Methanosarcina mazei]|nr:DUF4277 domain-containing protein [Methanosarcina mazei]
MVLNGLVSTERLFGDGIIKEDLNQYAIGETLDRIVMGFVAFSKDEREERGLKIC